MIKEADTGLVAVYCCVATKDALIVCVPNVKLETLNVAVPVASNGARPSSLPPSEKEIMPEVTGAPATTAVAFKVMLSPNTPVAGIFKVTFTALGCEPVVSPLGGYELPYFPATYNEQVWFAGK